MKKAAAGKYILAASLIMAACAAEAIQWQSSYEEAVRRAKSDHKPVMLYFYRDTAPQGYDIEWQRQMENTVFNAPAVNGAAEKYLCIKLEVTANKEMADKYGCLRVSSGGGIVFMSPELDVKTTIYAFKDANVFAKSLNNAAADKSAPKQNVKTETKTSPDKSAPQQNSKTEAGSSAAATASKGGVSVEKVSDVCDIGEENPAVFNLTLSKKEKVYVKLYDKYDVMFYGLKNEVMDAGKHVIKWDGTKKDKSIVKLGVYTIEFTAGDFKKEFKITVK